MGLLKIFLAIGIAVLLAVFVGYGLEVLYPNPQYGYVDTTACYNDFPCQNMTLKCSGEEVVMNGTIAKPALYNEACYSQVYASADYQKCMTDQQDCTNKLNQNSENYFHARNSFYILILFAIAAIIAGVRFWKKEGIGSGFMGGGVLIVLYSIGSTYYYWSTLNKYLRLVAIGAVLVLLIWLGYKKIEDKVSENKKSKKRK
ncbi:MAG TPA: hypothetical protein VHA12_01470 [Candidatus Nanoarchaeia archaeon]|nr:hypothetical protein [Candidatus Nanoarchaeia archaeon]